MVMMRATFIFEDENKHGWSETIHHSGATIEDTINAAKLLFPLRVRMLGDTAFLTLIRVSDDEVKRDSGIFRVPFANATGSYSTSTPSDSANLALILRMESASPVRRRTLYMSGVPDAIIDVAGQYRPGGAFQLQMTAWADQLVKGGWMMRNRSGVVPVRQITILTQDATTGLVTVTTDVAHGFGFGDLVVIKGTVPSALNGTWKIFPALTATTFQILVPQRLPLFMRGGTVNKLDYTLTAIKTVNVMRANHRNRGRFFDSPVGRRRARTRT